MVSLDYNLLAARASDNPKPVKMYLSETARALLRKEKARTGFDMSAILDVLIRMNLGTDPAPEEVHHNSSTEDFI